MREGKENVRRKRISVQDYNFKELAEIYNVSRYLLHRKLFPHRAVIGEPKGYYYEASQVQLIFKLIALPSHIEIVKTCN